MRIRGVALAAVTAGALVALGSARAAARAAERAGGVLAAIADPLGGPLAVGSTSFHALRRLSVAPPRRSRRA